MTLEVNAPVSKVWNVLRDDAALLLPQQQQWGNTRQLNGDSLMTREGFLGHKRADASDTMFLNIFAEGSQIQSYDFVRKPY